MSASLLPSDINSEISQLKGQASIALAEPLSHKPKGHLHLVVPEGQLKIHTSSHRGSFSNVLSEALRAAGLGSTVVIAQLLKGGVDQGTQGAIRLCGRLEWIRPAISCYLTENSCEESCQVGKLLPSVAVDQVWQVCKNRLLKGEVDQLVLDEVGLAISLGYLKEEDVIDTLTKRPKAMDVILTGPAIPSPLIDIADQLTQLRCSF